MLYDDGEARLRVAGEPTEPAQKAGTIPDWDEVILILQAASADELFEDRNSHNNAAWAKLVAALVEQQHPKPAKPD